VWETFTNGCVLRMEAAQSTGAPLDAGFRELRLRDDERERESDSCSEDMTT
jgi:hypothetical protein